MGKASNFVSGGFSGRMGNIVGYQWRGKWCVRSMPTQYRDAKTEYQLAQRALFKATVGFAAKARKVLKLGLRTASLNANMTENNYFMRINKGCFAVANGQLEVDYESLLLSEGPVAPVAFGAPQLLDDTTVSVDFEKNPLHRAVKSNDEVYLAAYCPELDSFALSAPSCRYMGNVELRLHSLMAGKEVHLWGFVVDSAGRASTSQYIGSILLDRELWQEPEEESEEFDETTPSSPKGPTRQTGSLNSLENNAGGDAAVHRSKPPGRDVG